MARAGSPVAFQNPEPFQLQHDGYDGSGSAAVETRPQQRDDGGKPSQSKQTGSTSRDDDGVLHGDIEDVAPGTVETPDGAAHPLEPQASSSATHHRKSVKMCPSVEVHEVEPSLRKQKTPPHNSKVHLVTPFTMLATLLVGSCVIVVHNFYYASLVGTNVGGSGQQQSTRFLGNFLPVVVQTCLVASIDIAFTQWLFLCLKMKSVTVRTVDSAYGARGSLLFLLNGEMLRKLPVITILALISWALPIPTTLITPGTLFVSPQNVTSFSTVNVPLLNISTKNMSQSVNFHVSRPAAGPNNPNNSSLLFQGPRTIVSRLSAAAAALGQVLPIPAPSLNSAYAIQFLGPSVQCGQASETEQALIQNVIAAAMQPNGGIQQIYNAYFAYVPDLSSADTFGNNSAGTDDPTKRSNQLWMAFQRNDSHWTFPRCNNVVYQVCQLVNANYSMTISFENGNQIISRDLPEILAPIAYPVVNLSMPSDPVQLAYSAYMWAFTELLTGEIGLFTDNAVGSQTPAEYIQINSNIENTALLGTTDLNCAFALDSIFYNETFLAPPTPQRSQDIQLAEGKTFDELIPELAFNLTVSLMSDNLLAPASLTNVTTINVVPLYEYRSLNLRLAYGMAVLVAVLANILGLIAVVKNGVTVNRAWTSIVGSTTDIELHAAEHRARRGSLPLPKDVEVKLVKIEESGQFISDGEVVDTEWLSRKWLDMKRGREKVAAPATAAADVNAKEGNGPR